MGRSGAATHEPVVTMPNAKRWLEGYKAPPALGYDAVELCSLNRGWGTNFLLIPLTLKETLNWTVSIHSAGHASIKTSHAAVHHHHSALQ